jgi:hypothetical protein
MKSEAHSNRVAVRLTVVDIVVVTFFLPLAVHPQTGCFTGSVVDNTGAPVKRIRITLGDNVKGLRFSESRASFLFPRARISSSRSALRDTKVPR